ncbi:MAG: hypothetical protein RJS98_09700, partial [Rhodospirillaceae bacterium]
MKAQLLAAAVAVSTTLNPGGASSETLEPWWSQEVTECDLQTSHGLDPFHVAPPVSRSTMDFEKAQA